MKKSCLFIAAALVALAASCTKENERITPMATGETGEMTLRFTPYDIKPGAKSSGIANFCSRLDVYLVDTAEHDTIPLHQSSTDANFGTVSAVLKTTKTYKLLAIAHGFSDTIELHNGIFELPTEKVKQTMVAVTEFTPADSLVLNVAMQRIVGMFKMKITDPDSCMGQTAQMHFTVDSGSWRWHEDWHGVGKVTREVLVTGMSRGSDGCVSFNVYTIPANMEDITYINITATAEDAEGHAVETREFEAVPIKAGYVTTYTGTFFITFQMAMGFSVGDWSDLGTYTF